MSILTAFSASPSASAVIPARCDFWVLGDSVRLLLFLTETAVAGPHDNRIIPRKNWNKNGYRVWMQMLRILQCNFTHTRVSDTSIFKRTVNLRDMV